MSKVQTRFNPHDLLHARVNCAIEVQQNLIELKYSFNIELHVCRKLIICLQFAHSNLYVIFRVEVTSLYIVIDIVQ